MAGPSDLEQWSVYVGRLAGDALWSKAIAANTETFAVTMLAAGWEMSDVEAILGMFARQFKVTGVQPPGGGSFDLRAIADQSFGIEPMDVAEVAALAALAGQLPEDAV